jgi:hypothetical protein
MFEMSAGFALELTADDMRAMAEEALALAARADEWTERSAKIKAYAKGLEAK